MISSTKYEQDYDEKSDAVFVEDEAFHNIMSSLDDVINEAQDDSEEEGLIIDDDSDNLVVLDEVKSDESDDLDPQPVKTDPVYKKQAIAIYHSEIKELEKSYDTVTSIANCEVIPHPYSYLIDTIQLTQEDCKLCELYDITPMSSKNRTLVSTKEALMIVVKKLRNEKEIALDVYADLNSYEPIISAIGISTKQTDYIIDVIELKTDILVLTEIFLNPRIVKVLTRLETIFSRLNELNLFLVNVFCLEVAEAAASGEKKPMPIYIKIKLDYGYTVKSMASVKCLLTRPLSSSILDYMQSTTHYLLHMYLNLKNDLLTKDIELFKNVVKSCNVASKIIHKESSKKENVFKVALASFKRRQKCELMVFIKLNKWREEYAKTTDIKATNLLSNYALRNLAMLVPTSIDIIREITKKNPLTNNRLAEIIRIIYETKKEFNITDSSPLPFLFSKTPLHTKGSKWKSPSCPPHKSKAAPDECFSSKPQSTSNSKPPAPSLTIMSESEIVSAQIEQLKQKRLQHEQLDFLSKQTKMNQDTVVTQNEITPFLNQNQSFNNSMIQSQNAALHNQLMATAALQNQGLHNMAMHNQAFTRESYQRDVMGFTARQIVPQSSSTASTSSTGMNITNTTQNQRINEAAFKTALELWKQSTSNSDVANSQLIPSSSTMVLTTSSSSNASNQRPVTSDMTLSSIDEKIMAVQKIVAQRLLQPPEPPSPPSLTSRKSRHSPRRRSSHSRRKSRSRSRSRSHERIRKRRSRYR